MTTATALRTLTLDRGMTAPTRDAWRGLYAAAMGAHDGTLNATGALSDAVTGFHVAAEDLFTDLRPSEEAELQELVHDALDPLRARFTAELIEAAADVLATFAERHPDAPRSKVPAAVA